MLVRDYLPLQQGLRHVHSSDMLYLLAGQRLSSTTTRIKTVVSYNKSVFFDIVRDYLPLQQGLRHDILYPVICPMLCQRLSSTTTRIKTLLLIVYYLLILLVRDYLPLQQGLRPNNPHDGAYEPLSETIFHYNKD